MAHRALILIRELQLVGGVEEKRKPCELPRDCARVRGSSPGSGLLAIATGRGVVPPASAIPDGPVEREAVEAEEEAPGERVRESVSGLY